MNILGKKMLIFVDSRYTSGYGYSGLLTDLKQRFGNVHEYTYPADITDCHLLGKAVEKLITLRVAKWSAEENGQALT